MENLSINPNEIPDNDYTKRLVSNFDVFGEIYKECGYRWMPGCGSYLFNGSDYRYYSGMYSKQKLLYDLAKKAKNVLEIGTYMGHSLFIMLLANPYLNVTCIDIDNTYCEPAISVLRKRFPEANIKFICSDSISSLKNLNEKFDLFHIDGNHENDYIENEFNLCKRLNLGNIMNIIFDDISCCMDLKNKILSEYKIIEDITPNCDWTNGYLKINIREDNKFINDGLKTKEAFSRLKRNKKAYLICSVGQKYIDMTECLINQIHKYSKYPVFLYYSNGSVNFDSPSLIKQRFEIDNSINFSIDGIDPTAVKTIMLTTVKPRACSLFLENYDIEEFIFLDTDILITPSIDKIFDEYSESIENYPIFLRYSWDFVTTNGKQHVPDLALEKMGISRNPTCTSLCTCFFIANKNCKTFFLDWKRYCEDSDLIKFALTPEGYGGFTDEAIANGLIWSYGGNKSIPTNLMWAWKYDPVKFAFDFYDGLVDELPRHSSQPSHYQLTGENEVPYGLTVIPQSKQDWIGTHFIKDPEIIRLVAEEIDKRF
jgi:hypothetical protein